MPSPYGCDSYGFQTSWYGVSYGFPQAPVSYPGSGSVTSVIGSIPYDVGYCGPLAYRPRCTYNFDINQGREAITLLREFSSLEGSRRLIAATQSRIYALNERSRNWRILADGLGGTPACGCGPRRFQMARLGDYAIFTNNYDPVLAWHHDDPATGCAMQSANPIESLSNLGVTKAGVAVEFKGFLFLMDLEVDGIRYGAKLVWSDFGNPTSWAPVTGSLASDMDIGDTGERIIGAEPLGNYLIIYKERSIWRVSMVGLPELFHFDEIYRGEETPRFRNTITKAGDAHYYFGHDTIYRMTMFSPNPERLEWIHDAAGMIFDDTTFSSENLAGGIDFNACDLAVGGHDPTRDWLWFSWVSRRNQDGTSVAETASTGFSPQHTAACPNRSMVINLRHPATSYVDHGFSAFGTFRSDTRPTTRDWLVELGACSLEDMPSDAKEGEPNYSTLADVEPVDSLWNATEDVTLPSSANSLCARLDDAVFEDFCEDCPGETKYLMACAVDLTIKEFSDDTYSREHFDWVTGLYSGLGYDSALETGAMDFGMDEDKYMRQVMVEHLPPVQSPSPNLNMKLAFASQPSCPIWKTLLPQPLRCETSATQAGTLRPQDKAYFNYLLRGRYLFCRTYLTGTTGPTCLSGIRFDLRRAEQHSGR